jgi:cytochrome c oxidase cbb3-type subunit III
MRSDVPTKIEKDDLTGVETTGHEWDGIRELNTPLPRWWRNVFYATILFALVYVVLYPALPSNWASAPGLLGYNQRLDFEQAVARRAKRQAGIREALRAADLGQIRRNPELEAFAIAGGRAAFGDNCAPCHGTGGSGRPGGFPSLADDEWLWGGTLQDIHTSIRIGIRQTGPDSSRQSEMPAFGTAQILTRPQIEAVAEHVLSLSGRSSDPAVAASGRGIFAQNCGACHGDNGVGKKEFGAPNLSDAIWLHGRDRAAIITQITRPRHGAMPAWEGRLDPVTLKMLAVYVHSLGGGL